MHYVYIIFSDTVNRYYVGESAFPQNRVREHNEGKYIGASTKLAKDWRIVLLIKCINRQESIVVERYIKSMKSKEFLQKLINDNIFYIGFVKILSERFSITVIE